MTDDPCPRCGPLEDRSRELEFALADVTDQLTETAKRVEELEQALAEAQAKAVQWVSVEERLPVLGQYVQVFYGFSIYGTPMFDIGRCYGKGRAWQRNGHWGWCEVTHWAPLPKPPEEGTGK